MGRFQMTPTETIFEHWNSKKQRGNKWKSHRLLLPHIRKAIQDAIRIYSVDIIKEAIDNYAKVLLGREFKPFYAWTLHQFLTRHKPAERKELQLYRWIDFYEEEYYSDKYKKWKQQQRKIERENQDLQNQPKDRSVEELQKARAKRLREYSTEKLQRIKTCGWNKDDPAIDKILAERAVSNG